MNSYSGRKSLTSLYDLLGFTEIEIPRETQNTRLSFQLMSIIKNVYFANPVEDRDKDTKTCKYLQNVEDGGRIQSKNKQKERKNKGRKRR